MGLTRDTVAAINAAVGKAMTRLHTAIRRGTIVSASSAGRRVSASLSVSDLEPHEEVEVFEPAGFTCRPPAGATAIVLCPGGDTGYPIAIAADRPAWRPSGLGSGEPCVYVGNAGGTGARIILRTNGTIEVQPGPGAVVSVVPNGAPLLPLPVARMTDPVAVTSTALLELKNAFEAWVPVPNDGGAALKTALATFIALSDSAVVAGSGTITAGGAGMVTT
jgi:hypothetical protein